MTSDDIGMIADPAPGQAQPMMLDDDVLGSTAAAQTFEAQPIVDAMPAMPDPAVTMTAQDLQPSSFEADPFGRRP